MRHHFLRCYSRRYAPIADAAIAAFAAAIFLFRLFAATLDAIISATPMLMMPLSPFAASHAALCCC